MNDKATITMAKKLAKNSADFKADDKRLQVEKEDLINTNALMLWNSYLSNNDYFSKFRQIFSIIGFLCVEEFSTYGKGVEEALIEIFVKLIESPYRIVRFSSIIAFTSFFRSLSTSIDETEAKIDTFKGKKSAAKRNEKKYVESVVEELNEFIVISFEFVLLTKAKDICPIVREEVYASITHYLDKREFKSLENLEAELANAVLRAINDEDKTAKTKGIELAEMYLQKHFKRSKVSKKDDFYEDVLRLSLTNIASSDAATCFALTKVLKLLGEHYKPLLDSENFQLLKKFIFHTNPLVAKEFIEIICKGNALNIC